MNWGIASGQDSGSSYDIPGYIVVMSLNSNTLKLPERYRN